jgi:hypothetical protein
MSGLASLGALICVTRALRASQIFAACDVLMAPTAMLTITRPTISVFCGHGRAEPDGRSLLQGESKDTIRFELFWPASYAVTQGAKTLSFDGVAPLAFLWRAVEQALYQAQSPWADLWKSFVLRIFHVDHDFALYEPETGSKIACYVYEASVELIDDPAFGAPTDAWSALMTQMRAGDAEIVALADWLQAAIAGDATLADWVNLGALYGMSVAEAQIMGDIPLSPVATQDTPAADQITLNDTDLSTSITLIEGTRGPELP